MRAFPAAARRDAGHPALSDIKRGIINQFSIDMLVRLGARAGLRPKLKLAA